MKMTLNAVVSLSNMELFMFLFLFQIVFDTDKTRHLKTSLWSLKNGAGLFNRRNNQEINWRMNLSLNKVFFSAIVHPLCQAIIYSSIWAQHFHLPVDSPFCQALMWILRLTPKVLTYGRLRSLKAAKIIYKVKKNGVLM